MLKESICSYLLFCADNVILTKQINLHANNKSQVTRELTVSIWKKSVVLIFTCLQSIKAPRPDGLKGQILKECGGVMAQLFLDTSFLLEYGRRLPSFMFLKSFMPVLWTISNLWHSPLSCMERVAAEAFTAMVGESQNLLQFTYKLKQSVEDSSLVLLDTVTKHLDSQHSFVRIIFMDFL